MKIKVIFICHGNICRSPMAEYVLRDKVEKQGLCDLFEIASAATSREEIWNGKGNPVYPPAAAELKRHGIGNTAYTDFSQKRAHQITKEDYEYYDYILCAEQMNVRNAQRLLGGDPKGKFQLLLDYAEGGNISDPWYSGDFETAFKDIERGCKGFLEKVLK